ncbi:uncharacterized protein LOC131947356 isoform X2 [Physella acuta]|uniref:uncharacterized protein LOC131947356 isoform X2 n=1 Tax=Physella acuta TaxID=109671 RepID=UPI0027DDDEE6|nr:uncharacterized protein LOC131947356 isoform X2 [Physella acuta]
MRPRVQVKYVTEHMNYLEEKIHVIKPVVEALQAAVDKSKTWLEDKSDNESLTYCDLCQELESATLALLNVAAHILEENKDIVEDGRSFSSQSNSQTTTTEEHGRRQSTDQVLNEPYKPLATEILSRLEQIETAISSLQDVSRLEQIETAISSLQDVSRLEQIEKAISSLQDVSRLEQIETAISSLQDVSRLEQIETAISSLQDANDKSTDDISEIKQWRDNFVTEQSDMGIDNIENTISKLSKEVHLIESRVGHRYACHVALDLAPVSVGLIISRFWDVREYNGQHFNQTTGTFVSPHDGLYLVCVSLNEREDKQIGVGVMAGGRCCTAIEVKCAATSAAGSVVVDMKKGQELYFKVIQSDQGAKLSCYSSFTIVSL